MRQLHVPQTLAYITFGRPIYVKRKMYYFVIYYLPMFLPDRQAGQPAYRAKTPENAGREALGSVQAAQGQGARHLGRYLQYGWTMILPTVPWYGNVVTGAPLIATLSMNWCATTP